MTDLSVIILVGREERHIRRCLERLAPLEPRQVFVVESQKGDRTHEIAVETAKCLNWRIEECLNVREKKIGGENRSIANIQTFQHSNISLHSSTSTSNFNSTNSNIQTFQHSNIPPILSLVWHDWPGTQAEQFNWAIDNLPIEGSWVLRLDADEYLTADSIAWLRTNLSDKLVHPDVAALEFTLERKFCGGTIRHGTNGIKMVRMFRRGCARYDVGLMDERLVVGVGGKKKIGQESRSTADGSCSDCDSEPCRSVDGRAASMRPPHGGSNHRCPPPPLFSTSSFILPTPVVFYDDSLIPMGEWRAKHRSYAKREAAQALEGLRTGHWTDPRKASYYRLPPYFRAVAYFFIRYVLKRGFLDGYAGWMWNFWQGLWYRLLVDREISRLKKSN